MYATSYRHHALILLEIQNKEQKDQICSLKNKINNLEKKIRRTRTVLKKNQPKLQ